MRVVLINPPGIESEKLRQNCYPPMGLLYLASYLKKAGHRVKVIDANAYQMTFSRIVKEAFDYKPEIAGVSVFSLTLYSSRILTEKIKEVMRGVKLVIGGPGVFYNPEKILNEFKEVDFLIVNEAEKAVVKLCDYIQDRISLSDVPQLWYRKDGRINSNRQVQIIENLDSIEYPMRHLLGSGYKEGKYFSLIWGHKNIDSMLTSRGCPYKCSFCYNIKKSYKMASPQRVVEELSGLYNSGARFIRILDDNFVLDKKRIMKIFSLIIKKKLKVKLAIKSRADMVDKEWLALAKKAGTYLIAFGMESANQRLLDRMKKDITVDDIFRACRLTKEQKIWVHTSWIMGYPGETPETIDKTVKAIKLLKPNTTNLSLLTPFPGTEVYERAKAKGALVGDWDAQSPKIPWVKLPWVKSREEFSNYLQNKLLKIYLRPFYFWNYFSCTLKNRNMYLPRYAGSFFYRYLQKKL